MKSKFCLMLLIILVTLSSHAYIYMVTLHWNITELINVKAMLKTYDRNHGQEHDVIVQNKNSNSKWCFYGPFLSFMKSRHIAIQV